MSTTLHQSDRTQSPTSKSKTAPPPTLQMGRLENDLRAAIKARAGGFMKIDLDEPLTTTECARWLKLDGRNLLAKVREGKIPAMKLNERVFRFHPRSVLLALRQPGAQPCQD